MYEALLFLLLLLCSPFLAYRYLCKKKYRGFSSLKLGFRRVPDFSAGPLIWVHAVSVGEIKAVSALVKLLKENCPKYRIVISSITRTGHEEAKKSCPGADAHLFMPFDFIRVIRRFLKNVSPELVLISETDIWPNFLRVCKEKGARIALVNGAISERSCRRLKKVPFFARYYFSPFDLFLLQNEIYEKRFASLGIPSGKIGVIPNLKWDDRYQEMDAEELLFLRKRFGIKGPVITVGSTHEKEEEMILSELIPLLQEDPDLKIVLVPRHPERFSDVEKLLHKKGISYACSAGPQEMLSERVILVNEMGFLRKCYQISSLAVVAGSFIPKIGGHNIMEPSYFSVPCLFGPYMQKQSTSVDLVLKNRAGQQTEIRQLASAVRELLKNDAERKLMGERGKRIFTEAAGGSQKTFERIKTFLK